MEHLSLQTTNHARHWLCGSKKEMCENTGLKTTWRSQELTKMKVEETPKPVLYRKGRTWREMFRPLSTTGEGL